MTPIKIIFAEKFNILNKKNKKIVVNKEAQLPGIFFNFPIY